MVTRLLFRLVSSVIEFLSASTCLLPFVSLETRRIPASSSFISSRLSSLKLTSPRFDLSSFSRSMSVIGPFFSRTSTMDRDMGRGLHILFNAAVTGRDPTRRAVLVTVSEAPCCLAEPYRRNCNYIENRHWPSSVRRHLKES